ncbi:hypothetical protein, partial [Xanthobacter versatilis]|uniref:hypothetical protein n=1 Tax=Xanthobacter autotrophicus (strain ATCC BAA-1158 / Py2) TaxID=78245 RepID=UPI0037298D29
TYKCRAHLRQFLIYSIQHCDAGKIGGSFILQDAGGSRRGVLKSEYHVCAGAMQRTSRKKTPADPRMWLPASEAIRLCPGRRLRR